MPFLPDELPVSLEHLDDYLKAILKIKIREFVHLNPIFNCIPSIDVESYSRNEEAAAGAASAVIPSPLPQIMRPLQTRTQFKQAALNAVKNAALRAEVEPLSASRPKYYFAGHDVECPNRTRKLSMRRRPARRIIV
jgi:hypothetical protein